MDERRFSRLFPPELEHKILSLLGQLDLTRAALVCRRFRDMSESLLFRHIACESVYLDKEGCTVLGSLDNWRNAVFRILDDVTLGRHVRFIEVSVLQLCRAAAPGRVGPLNADDLHTLWSSMPGLIALSVNGWMLGQDLGLQNVDFPRLQRLRLDRPNLDIEFMQRHLPRLKHLSVERVRNMSLDCDLPVVTLVHYEGPFLLLMQFLRAGATTHSLESCTLFGDMIGSGIPPTLAPLARFQNLRRLRIFPIGADRAMLLELIKDCPPFTGVTSLTLDFDNQADLDMVPTSPDPPWSQLMGPFPAALYIVSIVDMEYNVVRERGLAWAKEISETCKDATVIVLSEIGFKRAAPGLDWVADDEVEEEAINASLAPPVVDAVPR